LSILELLGILAIITATAVDLKTPTHGTNAMMNAFPKLAAPLLHSINKHIYYSTKSVLLGNLKDK